MATGAAFYCGIRKQVVVGGVNCPCPLQHNLCEEYGGPWSEETEKLTKRMVGEAEREARRLEIEKEESRSLQR